MKIEVELPSWEVQNVLLQYISAKFKDLAEEGDYISSSRLGDAPPVFKAKVESVRPSYDDR